MRRDTFEFEPSSERVIQPSDRGRQRVGRAKRTLQVPLDPVEYRAVSVEAERDGLSIPEIIRRRLRTGAEAEEEIMRIVNKILAIEEAGFVLTVRAQNGESIDLKPISLFLIPVTTRIPKRDPKP